MPQPAVLFWSGGKDSALALFCLQEFYPEVHVVRLITTLNPEYQRISMHGVREELLDRQAAATGLPLQKMWVPAAPDNGVYEAELNKVLAGIKQEGIDRVVFGDIFLEDLREYRDHLLSRHQLTGIYPLWKKPPGELLRRFFSHGFAAITCCINTGSLDERWLGKIIDPDFMEELPANTDPCGENGEYHSFCYKGPVFKNEIALSTGEKQFRPLEVVRSSGSRAETGFYYLDLL